MPVADAAIAANRFGLGARPGELAGLGADARGKLARQLQGPPPLIAETLPPSHELLAKVIAQRAALRENGNAAPGAVPAGGASTNPPSQSVVAIAKTLRDIYLPAYLGDVTARFRAAVTSERSFLERLVHFWSNHFAVSVDKLVVLGLAGAMEREAVRPHVLGRFSDMLLAVERHPAMLLYLDNAQSVGPQSRAAQFAGRRGRNVGLNENLGREILELHTLGVDAGYTQDDVRALASIITGWSIGGNLDGGRGRMQGGEPGKFHFREILHEPGKQSLMGKTYGQEGVEQGEAALRDLALSPHTARHLATKLARHFIADDPPPAVVDRLTAAYQDSRGDLPTVYRALLDSPESWTSPALKFKTPAEYLFSAYRALDLPVGEGRRGLQTFELLGQRNFQPGSPAGWPDRSADWDGSAALLKRLEWAQALGQRLGSQRDAVQVADAALGSTLQATTRRAIERAQDGSQALTLLLAAPDFMRR